LFLGATIIIMAELHHKKLRIGSFWGWHSLSKLASTCCCKYLSCPICTLGRSMHSSNVGSRFSRREACELLRLSMCSWRWSTLCSCCSWRLLKVAHNVHCALAATQYVLLKVEHSVLACNRQPSSSSSTGSRSRSFYRHPRGGKETLGTHPKIANFPYCPYFWRTSQNLNARKSIVLNIWAPHKK
jgi:hypothetical protein